MKFEWKTGFGYWFVHFSVEVICFYTVFHIFKDGYYWWMASILYDTLAFAPQAAIGSYCEKHPKFRPGITGGLMLIAGSAVMLAGQRVFGAEAAFTEPSGNSGLFIAVELTGLVLLTLGNCLVHISGALATLRVSEGRLAESAVFVGGGSFGLITGRLLSTGDGISAIPFVLMLLAAAVMILIDRGIRKKDSFDFDKKPCMHRIAADRSAGAVIAVLAGIVVVRAYIGYGLPTAWNKTTVQTVLLYVFMGSGKMLGGILSDIFGAKKTGIISCLFAVPMLLISNNIMWLSLIGVACFSMTMPITLAGLVSVIPGNPGTAFGITTIALLLGTLPTFFFAIPGRRICDVLIIVMSLLAAAGFMYVLKGTNNKYRKENL